MLKYLTELFNSKTPLKQPQKDSASQAKQPVCYMLIKNFDSTEPLNIDQYLKGTLDKKMQTNYQNAPQDFEAGDQRQVYPLYKCYNSIEDLARGEFGLSFGGPSCSHPKSTYILRFGFDKATVLSLVESGQFHLAIIDAFKLADFVRVYGIDRIYGNFTSTSLPVPPESVEIIENPDFSSTLPQDVSEKTTSLTTCKH